MAFAIKESEINEIHTVANMQIKTHYLPLEIYEVMRADKLLIITNTSPDLSLD